MQYVRPDVSTICVGLAACMGQFLLCAGAPGKRFALPHSRILMHQPSGSMQGQAADIAIQAEQIIYLKRMMAERIAFHTGPAARADRDGLGPRPLVHRRRGLRVRLHRPGDRPLARPRRRQGPNRRGSGRPGLLVGRRPETRGGRRATGGGRLADGGRGGRCRRAPGPARLGHPGRHPDHQRAQAAARDLAVPRAADLPRPHRDQGQVQELGRSASCGR